MPPEDQQTPPPTPTRHPSNVPPKWSHLLNDPNVARWHLNLAKGSPKTSKSYLGLLGIFTQARGETPAEFIAMGQRACEDVLHDWANGRILEGKAGSSTDYYVSVVQSWMKWNDIPLRRAIKIPQQNYNPRLKGYHIPTMEELRRVLALCDGRQKMTLALIAFAGIRPGAIGNFTGSDGLRFSDLHDAHFESGRLVFDKVPTRIVVRAELSKAKHEYFTMLGPEGCEYIGAYAGQRVYAGEILGPSSPLLPSQRSQNPFLLSESIGDLLRRPMREAGLQLPPYIWRSYFNNRALLAETEGFVRDYRVFFMGHRGDMEHTYALRKTLPDDMLAGMRRAYGCAIPYLETRISEKPQDPMRRLAEEILIAAGLPAEKAKGVDTAGLGEQALDNLLRGAAANRSRPKSPDSPTASPVKPSQRIVTLDEMRVLLNRGWRFIVKLTDEAYLVEKPGPAEVRRSN